MGLVTVEDKLEPEISCPDDITITCFEEPDTSLTGVVEVLNCELEYTIEYVDEVVDNGNCGDPRMEIYRTWIVTDGYGNSSTCIRGGLLTHSKPNG